MQREGIARALERNDRFLVEVVEAFEVCPFARGTRTSGKLARDVQFVESAAEVAARIAPHDEGEADIVLIILPAFFGDSYAFDRFVEQVRVADAARRQPPFAMAPFHPDTPYYTDKPSRLVGLFRRSPDPTIQLVRYSALESAKRRAPDGKFYFDGSPAAWAAIAARPERGLSDQITHDNFERLRARADELAAKLTALRSG
jgi:hypothetical protein